MRIVTTSELESELARVPPGGRVVASGNFATPRHVLDVVDKTVSAYRLNMLNAQRGLPDRDGVVWETTFVGTGMRRSPRLSFVPARLSLVPLLFHSSLPPDVVVLHTSTPRGGRVSLGIEVNVLPAAVEAARARGGIVIAQLNPRMPFTHGDALLDTDAIDFAFEAEQELEVPSAAPLDDVAQQIGRQVAGRIGNGATLQLGIGAVPDAVVRGLAHRQGMRVWSEMLSDGVLDLVHGGALDEQAPVVASFVFGTPELYAWVDDNPQVRLLRTERTNDPAVIATNRGMTSVNTALQIDLFAQANASRISGRIYSGFGGQTDFIVGALHAPEGQALMALRSWHPKADRSTIVPLVDEPVTSFQPSAVITEQGTAEIWGHDERSQASELIENAAHPNARDDLWEEAHALGLA